MRLITLFSLLILSVASFSVKAQNISEADIKTQFVKEWMRAKAYTLEYLNAMPSDKYSFKAVDSIRSFAQQMLHLASGNYGLINLATGATANWPGWGLEQSPTAQNKDSVVYYVSASYDFAIASIQKMDTSKLGEMAGLKGYECSRFALLLKAFEHQTHHRGQTTIYIRLQGIKPPDEKLF